MNTQKLQNDLDSLNQSRAPMLSPSYLYAFQTLWKVSNAALTLINAQGLSSTAVDILTTAIKDGRFTTNINGMLDSGTSTDSATFFLFNLWMAVKALDPVYDVDALITEAKANKLCVPDVITAGKWWNGAYTTYAPDIDGSVYSSLADNFKAAMPDSIAISTNWGGASHDSSLQNGYAQSFCLWGPYNYYK